MTADEIKSVLREEGQRHQLVMGSSQHDGPPLVASPHQAGFTHEMKCSCGFVLKLFTQHSIKTVAGQNEFSLALQGEIVEHLLEMQAQKIVEKFGRKQ